MPHHIANPTAILLTFPVLITIAFLYYTLPNALAPLSMNELRNSAIPCDLFRGRWVRDVRRRPVYDETCPFHRNSWNCIKNKRVKMDVINSWKWVPESCDFPQINPSSFLGLMRNKRIGFVGDSLNENFVVSFLCILRVADPGAKKWKRKGAWRGAYFPKFNVIVAYHRAVLLAKYTWQQNHWSGSNGTESGVYRVDVDTPSDDWASISTFYDVLIFNTGHWWNEDKFPKEKPLVFYKGGELVLPYPDMYEGMKMVVRSMVGHIERTVSSETMKLWRLHSPRHFNGGEWNRNGTCPLDRPLEGNETELWFDPRNGGVNGEVRRFNRLVRDAVRGSSIMILDLTHLSEFRADAHPSIWLGRKQDVAVYGADCMHWCLPGLPDTWVDLLAHIITLHSHFT